MNVFSKRIFVCIALVFLVFTAISFKLINLIFFPAFLFLLSICYFILSKRKTKIQNLRLITILLIGASILGITVSNALVIKNNRMIEKYSGEHEISGYVIEVSSSHSFMCEYIVHVERLDGKKVNFDMVLVSDYQCELYRGDFFSLEGQISPLASYKNTTYLKNTNVYDYPLLCAIDEKTNIDFLDDEFRIQLMLSSLNSKLSSTLNAILGKEGGSLASALLLGNRELLSYDTLRDFKRAGVYHMLALSGLHVAILIGTLDWILKKLLTPRAIRICGLTLLSLFYISLTGFALSAVRSMLMLWIMYLSIIIRKNRDTMTSLFIAISVIVLIMPSAVLDVGLQLSFLSTFGVICASIIYQKLKLFKAKADEYSNIKSILLSLLDKLSSFVIASVCIFIFTLPILMICFGEVSIATFITNIFMGIICEIFMMFSLLALIFSWSPIIRMPFAEISSSLSELMTNLVSYVSDWDNVMLSLSYPGIELLTWGLFVGFLVLLAVNLKRKWLLALPCIAFAILLPINILIYNFQRDDFVRAEYIKSDSLILSSAQEVYICDLSDGSYGDFYESVKIAKENCFTEIEGIILTHYHSSHIISIERLIKSFKINSVLLPLPQNSDEDLIMRSIIRVLDEENTPAYIYEDCRNIDILGGKLTVSPRAYISNYSHPSVAVSFILKNDRLTLLGKPYFNTYLDESGVFKGYIESSDYLVFGSDGRDVNENYTIFNSLKPQCEISFSSFDLMDKSDFEEYIYKHKIYFDVEYKKYDLK